MTSAAKLLADALELPEAEREDLAAQLLDSVEPPPGISIEDEAEIRRRARQARDGVAGIPWSEVKRGLVK
jgi:putative addiction module component (TIGR02574 family)